MFQLASGDTFEFAGYEGVYMGKNDGLMEIQHMLMSLERHGFPQNPDVLASVVGSLAVVDMLQVLSPKRLLLFDVNPDAVAYGKLMLELIEMSENPQDFISAIFSRDARGFELFNGPISASNQHKFLEQPPDELCAASPAGPPPRAHPHLCCALHAAVSFARQPLASPPPLAKRSCTR